MRNNAEIRKKIHKIIKRIRVLTVFSCGTVCSVFPLSWFHMNVVSIDDILVSDHSNIELTLFINTLLVHVSYAVRGPYRLTLQYRSAD